MLFEDCALHKVLAIFNLFDCVIKGLKFNLKQMQLVYHTFSRVKYYLKYNHHQFKENVVASKII